MVSRCEGTRTGESLVFDMGTGATVVGAAAFRVTMGVVAPLVVEKIEWSAATDEALPVGILDEEELTKGAWARGRLLWYCVGQVGGCGLSWWWLHWLSSCGCWASRFRGKGFLSLGGR